MLYQLSYSRIGFRRCSDPLVCGRTKLAQPLLSANTSGDFLHAAGTCHGFFPSIAAVNYLAHMTVGHWAGLNAQGKLGNFVGDAVKGRDVEVRWGEEVAVGIRFHRALDEHSDRHEASRAARALIRPHCGKWSGVVWDVLADHVLASEFYQLGQGCGGLPAFAAQELQGLALQLESMPERSRRFYEAMVHHGWLTGYQDGAVVHAVLDAMSRRRSTAGPVGEGWKAFVAEEDALRECARVLIADMNAWGKGLDLVSLEHRPVG